jgi:ribosomal protein S18 acetylase RimI-like enzyme
VQGIGIAGGELKSVIVELGTKIIGFIFFQLMLVDECEDKDLFVGENSVDSVIYILTLGVDNDYRRCGLGAKLISVCMQHGLLNPKCGMVLQQFCYRDSFLFSILNRYISMSYIIIMPQ